MCFKDNKLCLVQTDLGLSLFKKLKKKLVSFQQIFCPLFKFTSVFNKIDNFKGVNSSSMSINAYDLGCNFETIAFEKL